MTAITNPTNKQRRVAKAYLDKLIDSYEAIWPNGELKYYWSGLPEAAKMVDCYYRDYRPDQIPQTIRLKDDNRMNLIVISESHARTDPAIVGASILPAYFEDVPEEHRKAGHVNLVHCLSYGESWLAGGLNDDKGANAGTGKFWKVLASLADDVQIEGPLTKSNWKDAFTHLGAQVEVKEIESSPSDSHDPVRGASKGKPTIDQVRKQRLRNKIRVLDKLKLRRIHLLDLSLAHIYLASGSKTITRKDGQGTYYTPNHKLSASTQRELHSTSWENYIAPLLRQQRPHHVLFLGTTLPKKLPKHAMEELCCDIGAEYHGTLTHPSFNGGKQYWSSLNTIRAIAAKSQCKMDQESTCPGSKAERPSPLGEIACAESRSVHNIPKIAKRRTSSGVTRKHAVHHNKRRRLPDRKAANRRNTNDQP